jgi:7,8-dihydroneopterin aldolase/epimerase/oxygenase
LEGIIKIEDFRIKCIIGAHAYERRREQEIAIDVEMKYNFQECAQTDSIVDTVNYDEVAKICRQLARNRKYHLLETFAYEMAHVLKETFSLPWVKVRIKKKKAIPKSKGTSVELELTT